MTSRRKASHVNPNLSQYPFGGTLVDARDAVEQDGCFFPGESLPLLPQRRLRVISRHFWCLPLLASFCWLLRLSFQRIWGRIKALRNFLAHALNRFIQG